MKQRTKFRKCKECNKKYYFVCRYINQFCGSKCADKYRVRTAELLGFKNVRRTSRTLHTFKIPNLPYSTVIFRVYQPSHQDTEELYTSIYKYKRVKE